MNPCHSSNSSDASTVPNTVTPDQEAAFERAAAALDSANPSQRTGSIELTPAAVMAVRAALAKRGTPNATLRLGVKPGGCNGFSYLIAYEDAPAGPHDHSFVFDEVRVVVDSKSLVFLSGSILDYEKTLMRQGFRFRNPNEASACGCGTSFSVK